MLTGFNDRASILPAKENDRAAGNSLFQNTGHGEGQHDIPDAVGPAEEDAH
jgi:hypothetical protein